VTVSLDPAAASALSAGEYGDTVSFVNGANGNGSTSRSVTLSVRVPAVLSVTPASEIFVAGPPGGPFPPSSWIYTLANGGGESLSWSAANTQCWLILSPSSGFLAPGESVAVAATYDDDCGATLRDGTHRDSLAFTNLSNGAGSDSRAVTLVVDPAFDTDGDGASDVEERGPEGTDLSYDGNVDGTHDWRQDNVASLASVDRVHYVTIEGSSSLAGVGASPVPEGLPAGVLAPYGFFSFRVSSPSAEGAATVRLFVDGEFPNGWYAHGPRPLAPEPSVYPFPYDPADGTGATFDGFVVTLRAGDGAFGDGDLAVNGEVAVRGGPVVNPAAPPNTGGGGGGGCSAAEGDGAGPGGLAEGLLLLAAWRAGRRGGNRPPGRAA
jgi:hypothetical protein